MVLDGVPADERPRSLRPDQRPRRAPTGLPPHDIAAEEAVVAALVLDDDAYDAVRTILQPRDFFREQNGWVYEACAALAERGESITIPSVCHELDRAKRLDAAGGEVYVAEIAGKYFTAVGVETHARIVARDALYRRTIQAAGQIAQMAYVGGPDAFAVLDHGVRQLDALRSGASADVAAMAEDLLAELESDEGDDARRITTGFTSLDRYLRGLKRGQISVWGGRQDSGKSALMVSMAFRQARTGIPVGYIPLEDSVEELWVRLAGDHLKKGWDYASKHRASGAMSLQEYEDFRALWPEAMASVSNFPIAFPRPGLTPASFADLEATAGMMVRRLGVQVLYVDYLDALPKQPRRGQSTADYVAEMMVGLQNLAIRLDVHIAIGSQVSNEGEKQPLNPPPYKFLLDSGGKARSARLIVMVGKGGDDKISNFRRPLYLVIDKLKGYPLGRKVEGTNPNGGVYPLLYLDVRTGLVREVGES